MKKSAQTTSCSAARLKLELTCATEITTIEEEPMKKRQKPASVYQGRLGDKKAIQMLKDQRVSVVVNNFHGVDWHKQTKVFPAFTVFNSPSDFPGKFVVRLFDGKQPTRLVAIKDTIEEARATIPSIFCMVPRSERDDRVIVETWL